MMKLVPEAYVAPVQDGPVDEPLDRDGVELIARSRTPCTAPAKAS
jgi:hypothetical protein